MGNPLCAICTSTVGPFIKEPLGKNDALVDVCKECRTETPTASYGPERAYEGAGAHLMPDEITAAMRRVMGDEAYERECERLNSDARRPTRAADPGELAYRDFKYQGRQRSRRGDHGVKEHRGIRAVKR